eukprot:gene13551-19422_t
MSKAILELLVVREAKELEQLREVVACQTEKAHKLTAMLSWQSPKQTHHFVPITSLLASAFDDLTDLLASTGASCSPAGPAHSPSSASLPSTPAEVPQALHSHLPLYHSPLRLRKYLG